jgi:hypothetical protein
MEEQAVGETGFSVYSTGVCRASVCADKNLSLKELTERLNVSHPTGIQSKWKLSKDPTFASGETNPCPCEQYPETRLHYLFDC